VRGFQIYLVAAFLFDELKYVSHAMGEKLEAVFRDYCSTSTVDNGGWG
jgi:hypothetical protein